MLRKWLFGMMTLIVGVMMVFAFVGCDDGNGNEPPPNNTTPQSVTYISEDGDGNLYTLVITENVSRSARYVAKNGDSFTFTVKLFDNGNYSVALSVSGTIDSALESGTEIEISITVNGNPLNITINGTEMTVIEGTIVLDDNKGEITLDETVELKPFVDKTALGTAISAANTAKQGVVVSVNGSDVLTTVYWVSESRMDTFTTAIATAQAVFDNENATQSMVDTQKVTLETATTAFNGQKQLGTKTEDTSEGVYIIGGYADANDIVRAGYWHNGTWHNLSVPAGTIYSSASGIAVSGTNIYIIGSYSNNRETETIGYWLNGVWNNLSIPSNAEAAMVSDIAISDNNVYIGGTLVVSSDPYRFSAGYWLNGIWHDLEEFPNAERSSVYVVEVNGNNVVFGGDNGGYACYWVNGTPNYYDDGYPTVYGLALTNDGKVHTIFNDYYVNGVKQDIGDYYTSCITASGNDVYLVGQNNGFTQHVYWLNGVRNNLSTPFINTNIQSIIVSGSNFHCVGYYTDTNTMVAGNYKRTAYYWFNNVYELLPAPQGGLSYWPGSGWGRGKTIAVVE